MTAVPKKVLLVGAGWFGSNHLSVWRELERRGDINLVGVVETDAALRKRMRTEHAIPVFAGVNATLLTRVDAVDIVTPTHTHFALAKKCLRYTHVFVEKPLAENVPQANELGRLSAHYGRVLMAGHIFRFHPVTKKLRLLLQGKRAIPQRVTGRFVSPISTWKGKTTALDNLHFFDILDYLFSEIPNTISSSAHAQLLKFYARYPNGMTVTLQLGWRGEKKERTLNFYLKHKSIHCDFTNNLIKIKSKGKRRSIYCDSPTTPLEEELSAFIHVLNGNSIPYTDSSTAARIIAIANEADSRARKTPAKQPVSLKKS